MSADIKQLRTRIKSVDSTLHLTKAMGLVASSKIRRATEAMAKAKEFSQALTETVALLSTYEECRKSPYMAVRDSGRTRLLVVAGDRGLAGGYNANVFRLMREFPEANVVPVGKRACDRFGGDLRPAEEFSYATAREIAAAACRDFAEQTIDRFGVVYTRYHSMMSQEATVLWLLPLERAAEKSAASAIFEPDAITVLNTAIPEYVAGVLVACVKESFASEVAARRVAMDSAGKNAQEMIDRLGLQYNRARQGAITQEITEIVAGSNA
ncbi:MAG: ATP synthase F1 subunit gamma [Clostridia bacterium]|nr:ATP synthase F1 subunit gamma [Clostridia bacterium]